MADVNLTYEFRELLRNCYFHPSREYQSMAVKLHARMAMNFLWQISEIAIGNFRFSQDKTESGRLPTKLEEK